MPAIPPSSSSPALSVIVVAADSGPDLRDCVRQVLACRLPLELILVDNASHDGVPPAIARAYEHDERLKLIYSHRNIGFGPAVNLGAKQAGGRALLILNPDCLIGEDDLRRLLAVQAAHPKAGPKAATEKGASTKVAPSDKPKSELATTTTKAKEHDASTPDGDPDVDDPEAENDSITDAQLSETLNILNDYVTQTEKFALKSAPENTLPKP